ncbi:histidine kinase [Polymorphospora sp. NPDC050346]|uniref:sensor histidine kinase n=1 Tax=Polymorphospora sp. NPDC050346 TaxID=3155780 RepID=UPI0033CD36D8
MTEARRRWWPDVLLGLVTAGLGLAGTWIVQPGAARGDWAGIVVAVLTGLALIAVRRRPWPVLVVESALLLVAVAATPAGGGTSLLAAAVALGYVAYRSGRASTAAAYALFLGVALANVLFQGDAAVRFSVTGVLSLIMLAGVAAAPVAFGRYLRGVRLAAAAAEERAREMRERRAAETRAARLAERAAIARDLHDIVAHHIAAIALRAGAARYAVQHTGRTEPAVAALGELRETAGQVLDELRELLEVLRDPETVERDGPQVELEQMIGDAARRVGEAGVTVRVSVPETLSRVPLSVGTTAARVVQEALTNTLKHAGPGATATVDIRVADGTLLLEVVDSGAVRERPVLPASGYGLAGMRERVGLLGGTLTAAAADRGGWRVSARLPIRENA